MLNESKGPAVWGPRAQADRKLYRQAMQKEILNYPNLSVLYDSVEDIIFGDNARIKCQTNDDIYCKAVILTTGTFLSGKICIGDKVIPAGRVGEKPSYGLSDTLRKLNLKLGRLKTGTPPRIKSSSIDYTKLEKQIGDIVPRPFSVLNNKIEIPQISCHITYTNLETHRIINDNLHKSAMYSGNIKGIGPRYCPSIEDKVVKFEDKDRHQVF